MAKLGLRAGACIQLGPIPSHPIPSHPIPSHPIPSHPIPSHPIPWGHSQGQDGRGARQTSHSPVLHPLGHPGAVPVWGGQDWPLFSSLSCSPSALAVFALCQVQP